MSSRVSVVLVTYNRATALHATLDSLLSQTYEQFELIICDDSSTDDTEGIAREAARVDPRVRYSKSERNLGMPANLNRGIGQATGELIANLHDGDLYAPDLLRLWVDALDACPRAAFVFNQYRALDPNGRTSEIFREPLERCNDGSVLVDMFLHRRRFDSPVWGTVMARRAAYEKLGLYRDRFGFCADVDMWIRMAENFHVAYVPEVLISLPAKATLPRAAPVPLLRERRQIRKMFWEARLRIEDPRIRRRELVKHLALASFDIARFVLIAGRRQARAALRDLVGPASR